MSAQNSHQPVLFLSHGAPPLADDATWTSQLHDWSASIAAEHERPKNILMVSAHWEDAPVTLSSTTGAPLVYDFWGFPRKYYEVTYAAPAAPELASRVEQLVGEGSGRGPGASQHVRRDEERGLDHGGYVPLVELFPEADVPVLQMSMPTLDPRELFALGERLAPLREEGTLIIGSGFTTHNLRWFTPSAPADAPAPSVSQEFDHWAAEALARKDVDALLDFAHAAPAAHEAHPRTEHWAPLFVSLGAAHASGSLENRSAVDGFWFGLSKRSWQFA